MSYPFLKRRSRRAFTLIEMLVSLALFSLLAAAAVSVLSQVSLIWAGESEDPMFDRHVEGLERFIRHAVQQAGNDKVVKVTYNPEFRETKEPGAFLALETSAYPWIDGEATSGGEVVSIFALDPEKGGLILSWRTASEILREAPPHRVLLSPWVTEIDINFYSWVRKEWIPPEDTGQGLAQSVDLELHRQNHMGLLRLTLTHEGRVRVLEIPLRKVYP